MSGGTGPDHDVVVVGAGQAGLALGYYLTRAGVDVLLLERAAHVGASWARRWDSLRLFTPARYDALPGLVFPGDAWSYPGKDQVAAYLADYAARFELPVRTGAEVALLEGDAGEFRVHLAGGEMIRAARVAVATGAFGRPWTPSFATSLDRAVVQVHTDDYQRPDALPPGVVLVVGGANSGRQIALELARAGRSVHLSEGARLRELPQRPMGRDLFWWLTATRAIHAPGDSLVGRRVRANEPVIGTPRRDLQDAGVTFHPRAQDAAGDAVRFVDGHAVQPAAVVWATGYRHDDTWVTVPGALDQSGALIVDDGSTPVPGLYAIGRPWQRDRGSALLGYVQRDAQRLATHLALREPERETMPAPRRRSS
ncbi:flavin-containing monooxygenase [Cellulosimicrobium funkei]|uniref:FAD-dependent oxidoreductase n=1 Tax=Cellulosimicrobium funkei TaxID=264251 RepID=A0A4Y8QXH7_9MICO|nr:NAD(P)/FAD-dependent oxidoreductase [Cellulosimicrobium funkei]TFF04456.1 FAD-dependent oxidoreductase [Cellulosimicrobium funkei]TGA67879.1 FAD-dependent oxidoreductase [Cellulosimicrobium terreum]